MGVKTVMQFGSDNTRFDLSDVVEPFDTTSAIVDVAVGVLDNYGGEDSTRIARMARWILRNAAVPVEEFTAGSLSRINVGALTVWRVGGKLGIGPNDGAATDHSVKHFEHSQVRELVSALMLALDRAES